MKARYILSFISAIILFAVLHRVFLHTTASLVLAPVAIAAFLATLSPMPVVLMALFALIFELTSTLPFGTMIGVISIPALMHFLTKTPADLTWKYALELFASVTVSIAGIILVKSGFHVSSWAALPLTVAGLQIACTSIATFIIVVAFHEYTSRS